MNHSTQCEFEQSLEYQDVILVESIDQ